MGWFEDQIKERRRADERVLEDSFERVAGVVLGSRMARKMSDDRLVARNAIEDILKYFHVKYDDIPDSEKGPLDTLDDLMRPYGIMRRDVMLEEHWYRDAYGIILAFTKEGNVPCALKPDFFGGYHFKDPETGKQRRVTSKTAALFKPTGYCFYRPLPLRKIGIKDLLLYMKDCVSASDILFIVAAAVVVPLVGMLIPRITKALTGPVRLSGNTNALMGIAVCTICVLLSTQIFGAANELINSRLQTKTSIGVQSAMMMRLLSLPPAFFRKYSAGELRSRSAAVDQLCSTLLGMVLSTGLTSLASLMYVTQIFSFAPVLVVPSLIIILVTVIFSVVSTLVQIGINKKRMELAARESGMTYSMITGVQKIKLSGSEKRIFAKWLDLYGREAKLAYDPPMFIKINSVISTGISLVSTIVLYYLAIKSNIDQSSYWAFMAAYGYVMGAFTSLSGIALQAARVKPIFDMAEPFLKAEPEVEEDREIVTGITGRVELDHVSFRYTDETPFVIKDLSLSIKAGEYVAIVGRTGCGKSTLVRLLLGFEKASSGSIYYDGKEISKLDPGSLRRQIGTVMQSGGLFQGDIYSNIVISAPELTLADAWEAAETAGIAKDIKAMPMGMGTVISEGQGGISGGQKQRIMIARAIAPKPKLLIFDEATSALDNKTQKQVSDALDAMGCTRIVIAHRLSTIRHCDRILVLDGGGIIEDGTYEELIARGGFFADLVERQRLDKTSGSEGEASK